MRTHDVHSRDVRDPRLAWHRLQPGDRFPKPHADDVARRYGFRDGRVPGTRVYAYLVQPAVKPWGLDPLEGGARAHAMFSLGLANTALSSNVELGPWTHVLREPRG